MDESVAQLNPESAPAAAELRDETAQPFDFRHPVFLSSAQWRKLRIELDEYAQSLAALLSTYFRLEFSLQVSKLQTPTFNEFTASLPVPTQLVLFKTDPLRGICLVEARPSIALAIVDRLLGGPGQAVTLERNPSEMEVALLDQFVGIVLSEWCKHWASLQDLKPHILGHENNPKFLQSSNGGTIMLVVTFEARLGESVGQLQLAFPYTTLEPLVEKLGLEHQPPTASSSVVPLNIQWNKALEEVTLSVSAHWSVPGITTRTLLALKVGDIVELPAELAEEIELRVGNMAKFGGRLGTSGEKRALQITKKLRHKK